MQALDIPQLVSAHHITRAGNAQCIQQHIDVYCTSRKKKKNDMKNMRAGLYGVVYRNLSKMFLHVSRSFATQKELKVQEKGKVHNCLLHDHTWIIHLIQCVSKLYETNKKKKRCQEPLTYTNYNGSLERNLCVTSFNAALVLSSQCVLSS